MDLTLRRVFKLTHEGAAPGWGGVCYLYDCLVCLCIDSLILVMEHTNVTDGRMDRHATARCSVERLCVAFVFQSNVANSFRRCRPTNVVTLQRTTLLASMHGLLYMHIQAVYIPVVHVWRSIYKGKPSKPYAEITTKFLLSRLQIQTSVHLATYSTISTHEKSRMSPGKIGLACFKRSCRAVQLCLLNMSTLE